MTGERGLQGALTTRAQLASAGIALLLLAVLGGLLAQRLGALDSSTGAGQALAGTPAQAAPPFTKHAFPEGLLGPASAAIGAAEPAYWAHPSGPQASARNRRQGFRIGFAPDSVSVHAARGTLTLHASAAGFGSSPSALPVSRPRTNSNRVDYRYGALEAWYLNGPLGLEQGFTVTSAPAHSQGQGLYTVELALGGTVAASLTDGGRALALRSPSGAAMRYGGLTATDATGTQLPAWLTLRGGTLALHVKTQGARFPVSIDPILTEEGLAIELGQAPGEVKGEKSEFGESVALSSDGTTALIGAPDGKERTGAAWVFHRKGAVWSQQGPALKSGAAKEENGCEEKSEEGEEEEKEESAALSCAFGRSVALSGNGDTALIGAPRAGSTPGVAWVFNRSGEEWTKESEPLEGPPESNQQNFGFSVALSLDGDHALIGAPLERAGHGAAYLFERESAGSPWSTEGTPLIPSGEEATGKFGFSAALSADGNEAVVGAPLDKLHKGTAYIFEYHKNEGKWVQVAGPLTGEEELGEARFGEDVAMSGDGSTVLIGGPRDNEKFGAVWTFVRAGAKWAPFGIKLVGPGTEAKEEFGSGIALSGDGSHALVGAPRANAEKGPESPGRAAGVVRLYEASKSEWVELSPTLNATLVEKGRGQFGRSVAMTENAETLLVGAPHETARAGAVWLFGSRPQITQVESDSAKGGKAKGRLAGGTKVRIVGYNFENVLAVWFGGPPNKAEIVEHVGSASPGGLETLVVRSPPGQTGDADCTPEGKAVGCVNVTVETADWLSAVNSSAHFMYLPEEEAEEHEREEHEHNSRGNNKNEKTVPFSQLGLGGSNGTLGGSNTKPPTPCSVALRASKVTVDSKARAHVSLAGHGTGKCGGRLTLQVKTGSGHHTHIKTIAAGAYVAFAGKASTVTLKLNSLGRSMLHHDHGHLKARLVILKSYPTPAKSVLAAVSVLQVLTHKR